MTLIPQSIAVHPTNRLYPEEIIWGTSPMNYAYKTKDGKVCHKVRGFSHVSRNDEILNFDSIRGLVFNELTSGGEETLRIETHNPHKIVWQAKDKTIHSKPQTKQYRMVFDKRVVDWTSFNSFPYGYWPMDPDDQRSRTLNKVYIVIRTFMMLFVEIKCHGSKTSGAVLV